MSTALRLLPREEPGRVGRDRLEILNALIGAPSFDALYRNDFIVFPRRHPAYNWACHIDECEKPVNNGGNLCTFHYRDWSAARAVGTIWVQFVAQAAPFSTRRGVEPAECRICPGRPAGRAAGNLCSIHRRRWTRFRRNSGLDPDFDVWLTSQQPLPTYGVCRTTVCSRLASNPVGLCTSHAERYYQDGRPGGARLPSGWTHDSPAASCAVTYDEVAMFRRWCATADAVYRPDALNLTGLRPLAKAEVKWCLHVHAQRAQRSNWHLNWLRAMVRDCRLRDAESVADLDLPTAFHPIGMIIKEMLRDLRLVYVTRADSKEAGFIETDHFGRRFTTSLSHIDLTGVAQRWLRDQLWDHLADALESPDCPRSRGPFDGLRRACLELGAFLAVDAPKGGHDPTLLTAEHARRFAADQRYRARNGLPSLVLRDHRANEPTVVSDSTTRIVFLKVRTIFHAMLLNGQIERIAWTGGS